MQFALLSDIQYNINFFNCSSADLFTVLFKNQINHLRAMKCSIKQISQSKPYFCTASIIISSSEDLEEII